jgi:hypothetical protein
MESKMSNIIKVDVSIDKPNELVNFAKVLKQVIIEQKLYANIQGKNYALVEAWQFCGGALRILPVVQKVENLSDDDVIRYRAKVALKRLDTNEVIGSGIAICTNKEKGKQYFEEYAIASMAQTRAIGKAYRNGFGWLMKLAGYEATPAEEMDFANKVQADQDKLDGIKAANKA